MRPAIYILSIFLSLSLWNVASADTQLGGAGNDPIFFPFEDHCVINCYSNVLFLPGIMGSRLYDATGNVRWLSEDDEEADYIRMNSDGTSALPDITTKDALDTADGQQLYTDIYKSFLNEMKTWESTYHITATTTPYDWRLDYETVVTNGRKLPNGHISYLISPEAGRDPYIIETLKQLAATSKTGKVTIIGHSQGGLIAKALMQQIGEAETIALIDKVILVATPQLGTPKAVAGLLNGTQMGIIGAVSDAKVRDLGQHTPSAFSLLPSTNYFTYVDDPVVTISSTTLSTWSQAYGEKIHDQQNMFNFMSDAAQLRTKPRYDDLKNPEIVGMTFLENARIMHNALDVWTPPAGVQLTTIAGWGMETLSRIEYYTVNKCVRTASIVILGRTSYYCAEYAPQVTLKPQTVVDGDGTVVEPSALWANGANSTRWWVNLPKYNIENIIQASPFGRDHKNILEVPQLRNLLENILVGTTASHDYISTTAPASTGNAERLHFTLHSPLTLGFTDTFGNYTGATATGTIFNIPDVHYERYGEVQWLSIPKELAGQLILHGTGSGSFTLDIDEVSGNDTLSATSFEGIPSSISTVVIMDITPSVSPAASSTLLVDYDGDRTIDLSLVSKLNEIVLLPPIKFPLTVTANSKTMTLGAPIPPLTATLSGFVDGDIASTSITGVPFCSTTATASSSVGTYPIVCTTGTLVSEKYDFITFTIGTLTIFYKWSGFSQPINATVYNPTQSMSVFKGGSTFPVKFQLKNASGTSVQAIIAPLWLTPQKLSPMNAPVGEPTYSDPATSGTTYKWDGTQYHYNWSTKGLQVGYWYRIYAKLEDGTIQSVVVGIR